jgi:hypothetical protein
VEDLRRKARGFTRQSRLTSPVVLISYPSTAAKVERRLLDAALPQINMKNRKLLAGFKPRCLSCQDTAVVLHDPLQGTDHYSMCRPCLCQYFPETLFTRGYYLLVYAPLMEIYLIRNEVSLSRSLSADHLVQRKRQSDARQTPHGDSLHREGSVRITIAVGNSAQMNRSCYSEPLRRHLDLSGSIGAQ